MLKAIAPAAVAVLSCFSGPAFAAEGAVTITHAWAMPTAPGQNVAGAYLEIHSAVAGKLIAASSPVAGSAEIHVMRLENNVMEMRQLKSLDLPAKQTVRLEPRGLHIMLLNLKRPLKPGDKIPLSLTLQLENGSKTVVEVQAEVRSAAP